MEKTDSNPAAEERPAMGRDNGTETGNETGLKSKESLEGKESVEGKEKTEGKERADDMAEKPGEKKKSMAEGKNRNATEKKTLRGSTAAKATAFFLLVISALAGAAATFCFFYLAEEELYTAAGGDFNLFVENRMWQKVRADYCNILFYYNNVPLNTESEPDSENESGSADGLNREALEAYCRGTNLRVEVYCDDSASGMGEQLVFGNYEGEATPFSFTYYKPAYLVERNHVLVWTLGNLEEGSKVYTIMSETLPVYSPYKGYREYRTVLYIDDSFEARDTYWEIYIQAQKIYELRYLIPAAALAGILLFFVCFVFLMCSAGHHNGREGITPGLLGMVHLDLLAGIYVTAALIGIWVFAELAQSALSACILAVVIGVPELVCGTAFCMEVMTRLKLGGFWKHTIIYILLRWVYRMLRAVGRGLVMLLLGIPTALDVVLLFFGFAALEFFVMLLCRAEAELAVLWLFEKVILFAPILYIAIICRRLKKGSEALAKGELAYQVDTSWMILGFKRHGENLNRIAQGMNAAVEQRMKSERLKTELITNVSHDLKTPLTSIINYADLIAAEVPDSGKAGEYAQVLLRQSRRLKKLLDDLMDASKAATGSLEVVLQPCEVNVLLGQAVGEYEQRFQEKGLKLLTRQPEGELRVMADGRHLWRVFDNLFNNICKYAQEDTRVYLSVEQKGSRVEIIFRNMSKYALEVSGEELQERFVRGDKSRHMEGNGLGLSIAKSLVELQNGEMEIVIDGDLFKVVLGFEIMK